MALHKLGPARARTHSHRTPDRQTATFRTQYRMFQMLKALPPGAVPVTAQAADVAADVVVQRIGSVSAGPVDAVVAVDDSMHPLVHVTALLNNS